MMYRLEQSVRTCEAFSAELHPVVLKGISIPTDSMLLVHVYWRPTCRAFPSIGVRNIPDVLWGRLSLQQYSKQAQYKITPGARSGSKNKVSGHQF